MPARRVFLHVGMPKCASTSLQGFMTANRELFAANKLHYDIPPEGGNIATGNAGALRALMAAKKTGPLSKWLKVMLNRAGDVFLSSEALVDIARFPHPGPFAEMVAGMGAELHLICIFRRQDMWIESDFKQHVKDVSPWQNGIQQLVARRRSTKVLDYHWVVQRWARIVDPERINVIGLNPGQPRDFVYRRVLQIVGRERLMEEAVVPHDGNVSPPVGLIEPARLFKQTLMAEGLTPEQTAPRLAHFLADAASRIEVPPRRFLLNHRQRQVLVDQWGDSNARLAEAFNAGRPLFGDKVLQDPASEKPLREEAAAVLIAYARAGGSFDPVLPEPEAEAGVDAGAAGSRWPERLRGWRSKVLKTS